MTNVNVAVNDYLRGDITSVKTINNIVSIMAGVDISFIQTRRLIELSVPSYLPERLFCNLLSRYKLLKLLLASSIGNELVICKLTIGEALVFNTVTGLYDFAAAPISVRSPLVDATYPSWIGPDTLLVIDMEVNWSQCSFTINDLETYLVCPNVENVNQRWALVQEVFPNEFNSPIANSVNYTSLCGSSSIGSIDSTMIFPGLTGILTAFSNPTGCALIPVKCSYGDGASEMMLSSTNTVFPTVVFSGGQWDVVNVPLRSAPGLMPDVYLL